ncbi:CEP104, partial [Symbiodinium pilosum]
VCLQFDSAVHLRQVQFLSHQSKIATKIELFTGLTPPSGQTSVEAVQFKRLGYLSLDSNERSQFQARELKSVYVDVVAQFLRILFHKCHINRYNALNQVGLIALSCLGEVVPPADMPAPAAAPAPPKPAAAAAAPPKVPAAEVKKPPAVAAPAPAAVPPAPQPAVEPPPAAPTPRPQPTISKVVSDLADLEEAKYDAKTLDRLRNLVLEKQQCVETEDYGGAKRCKDAILMLKQKGLQICQLEERKRAAVENEEYDVAKSLKVEIDRLRAECERAGEEKEEPAVQPPQ